MQRRRFAGVILGLGAGAVLKTIGARGADDWFDKQIADLAGEWEVTYTNDAVRRYTIDKEGVVTLEATKQKSQITRKGEALMLAFQGDAKVERLTMGVDGRLFVEHFLSHTEPVQKRPHAIGIGIRQK
jgi:hypothetical protein